MDTLNNMDVMDLLPQKKWVKLVFPVFPMVFHRFFDGRWSPLNPKMMSGPSRKAGWRRWCTSSTFTVRPWKSMENRNWKKNLGTYIVTTPNPKKPSEALMFYLGFSGNSTTIISSSSPNPPNSTRWRIFERSGADSKLRVSTWWCQQKLKARGWRHGGSYQIPMTYQWHIMGFPKMEIQIP